MSAGFVLSLLAIAMAAVAVDRELHLAERVDPAVRLWKGFITLPRQGSPLKSGWCCTDIYTEAEATNGIYLSEFSFCRPCRSYGIGEYGIEELGPVMD
jgi:hypothetical protein